MRGDADAIAARSAALDPEQRRTTQRCLSLLGALATASLSGVAFSLYLVGHYPLLLIALSPLGRHLVLVVPSVSLLSLIVVAGIRRMVFYLTCFRLGQALGPAGIPWIEERAARFGRFVRLIEGWFSRAPHLVVLIMTGPTGSALAGVAGMRTGTYVPLAIISVVLRLLILFGFAEWIQVYLEIALVWINEYWLPGTVVLVMGVGLYRWRRPAATTLGHD